jgi:chromosome partitioning protein
VSSIQSNNAKQIAISLSRMSVELQFRTMEGLHDRVIFRELFPIGLTALDPIEEAARGGTLSQSQLSARKEIEALVTSLQLPERSAGMAYLQSRHVWFERMSNFYRNLRNDI